MASRLGEHKFTSPSTFSFATLAIRRDPPFEGGLGLSTPRPAGPVSAAPLGPCSPRRRAARTAPASVGATGGAAANSVFFHCSSASHNGGIFSCKLGAPLRVETV